MLTTHVNPDGDAIGSELALAAWLSDRGKDVAIVNVNSTPVVYKFLDPHSV
ncbi:MAG: exopolyphosphatase-like enzyme, partial [Bacteroidetes bacterium]|nr:exopolyphosphatase-like enzyme [Bacteroidota bacterium]